jgi:hypothetical protein
MFRYFICWQNPIAVIDVDEITGEPVYLTDWSMQEVTRKEAAIAINAGFEVRIKMIKGKTKWHFCHMYGTRLVCDELPF